MIHENLKRILKRRGWSQSKLAEKIGWSEQAVNAWVNGKSVPNAYALYDIAKALNINIMELYGEQK